MAFPSKENLNIAKVNREKETPIRQPGDESAFRKPLTEVVLGPTGPRAKPQ
jgi:hypothetical protein